MLFIRDIDMLKENINRIIIVNNNLHIGGVQKALVNLLWNIREKYDITLLLFHPEGAYMSQLPPEVKVITPDSGYRYLGMPGSDAKTLKDKLGRTFYAGISRVLGRKWAVSFMKRGQKTVGEYDVAISYLHNSGAKSFYGGCNDFVLNHVSAKKKIAFLHCDYTLSGCNTPDNNRQYARFDTIAACSQGCAEAFLSINPGLADRVKVVPNCHRFDQIRQLAQAAPVALTEDKIHLLTVARLGREKGVERAVQAIAGLGALKERIHYYIIGDGAQKAVLLETLEREQLQGYVTVCGKMENPYGYMKAADLLLIPSRSEAAPLVIGEAASLGTPVLSTKTSSAVEMIAEPSLGWVCENNVQAMTDALAGLVANPGLIQGKNNDLENKKFHNEAAIALFAQCLEQ